VHRPESPDSARVAFANVAPMSTLPQGTNQVMTIEGRKQHEPDNWRPTVAVFVDRFAWRLWTRSLVARRLEEMADRRGS
jgi:hypothetical protein